MIRVQLTRIQRLAIGILVCLPIWAQAGSANRGNTQAGSANGSTTQAGSPNRVAYSSGTFYPVTDAHIRYGGRADASTAGELRFWGPGAYMQIHFEGNACQVYLKDQQYGGRHNWIQIAVDGETPYRLQTRSGSDTLNIEARLKSSSHVLIICKNTETQVGYLGFAGVRCKRLLDLPTAPAHRIEFIGNSITCGASSDMSIHPCGQGDYYDQENAFYSYGPLTAKSLNADYVLTSVSGIGLMHSCCNMKIIMPQVFDKINLAGDSINWDFSKYQPDVVTVCLGQNDNIQDSATFCGNYIAYLHTLRGHYPKADLICLSSPMADAKLTAFMQKCLTAIKASIQKEGDQKVYTYFYQHWYHHGCGGHPDLQEHKAIAAELTAFIQKTEGW
jgi:hypothetical protein